MFFLFPRAAHIHENKLEITIEDKCEYCEDYSREADNIKQHKQRKQTRKYLDVWKKKKKNPKTIGIFQRDSDVSWLG